MGDTIPRQLSLGCLRKETEQARGRDPKRCSSMVSVIFPSMVDITSKANKSFLPKIASGHSILSHSEEIKFRQSPRFL